MPAAKKSPSSNAPARAPARRRPAAKKPAARAPTVAAVPVPAEPAPLAPPRKPAEAARPAKPRKDKLLRDSFTIPKSEYAVLEALKERAAKAGRPAKKSEVLRAGVKALSVMGDIAFLAALGAVPAIKTGRPAKT